ncbi:MAG TPA: hypothetical protein VI461_03635 [Chitinophagaceae bacterium]|nr:hypothetical protein [Chitinophagaceae bacterium]
MPKFIITLKNKKQKTYSVISWLIIALNFISLLYLGITRSANLPTLPYFAAGLLMIIFLFNFLSKSETIENDCISLSFSLVVIAWIVMRFYWAAVIIFILFLFQDISRRQLVVLVYDDRVIYPSFPKRTIEWKEMNNIILKDGLLTIDLRNDKIFQNEIVSATSEMEFNEFCETQLKALKN